MMERKMNIINFRKNIKRKAYRILRYLYPGLIISLSILCFAYHIAIAEEGPVYNFNFNNKQKSTTPNPETRTKNIEKPNELKRGAPTPLSTKSEKPISSIKSTKPKRTWGPQIGYFSITHGAPSSYIKSTENNFSFTYRGYSIGLKLPISRTFSVVPQYLQSHRTSFHKLSGVRLDLRANHYVNDRLAFGLGLSGVTYRETNWGVDTNAYGLGLFLGPSYTYKIFYVGTEARIDYIQAKDAYDRGNFRVASGNEKFLGYGLTLNLGLRI